MSTIRAQTKTTTDFKEHAVWHEVTMVQEYTRTVQVLAIDEEEAGEIAGNRARLSKAIPRLGYSLGDVEIIEAKELNFHHGNSKGIVKHYG
tara:strand:- start:22 stop:294 length:273 start_codon:yes stop_codon:yes gene_type:complete